MIFKYQDGQSFFHHLDPLSKLIWLICISVLALRFEDAASQIVLLLATALIGTSLAKLSLLTLWKGIRIPFWFGVPYFLLQLLFLPGETALLQIGGYTLTAESLDYAAAISARLITLILASFLFIVTTDPRDVVLVMAQKLRIPYRFAFAVAIALRFLPILEAEAAILRDAQRLRGGEPAGFRNKLESAKRFAFSVFASAIGRVQHIAEAMENKAFGFARERTYRRRLIIPPAGTFFSCASAIVATAALIFYS